MELRILQAIDGIVLGVRLLSLAEAWYSYLAADCSGQLQVSSRSSILIWGHCLFVLYYVGASCLYLCLQRILIKFSQL